MSLTQNYDQYPSFDVPKLPELDFTFCSVFGGGSIDVHEEVESGSKRSRVDVSTDEQKKVKKTRTLEERLAELDIPAAVTERNVDVDMFEDVAEQSLLNARALVKATSLLKEAIKDIEVLKARVEELEAGALDTQHDLDTAHHKITTHERIIQQVAGADHTIDFLQEYAEGSDGDNHSDDLVEETAPPQTDSTIY